MSNAKLETKFVNEIAGKFLVPSYQRGYRWGKEEVKRLLDDVYNLMDEDKTKPSKNYCLQPIVVKKLDDDSFEVIDGQQRLTTIFIIYRYMYEVGGKFIGAPKFSLNYETRDKSANFLKSIESNLNLRDENIDFHFMANAHDEIKSWFDNKGEVFLSMPNLKKLFAENVKIIWYEVDDTADGNAMFTRLNIGKIPLTSAELVKAMFLSSNRLNARKQDEIALQWDNMEKALHDEAFWYFLTNNSAAKYQTRIDIVLDLLSERKIDEREKYFTFFRFDKLSKEKPLNEIWSDEVVHTFLTLRDWYENHELYHKIGYLIASGYKSLLEIFKEFKGKTKTQFRTKLDELIKSSIALKSDENYLDWNYNDHREKIRRLLLLFNVESVRQNGENSQWFPFGKFKFSSDGKNSWSLEHINAVNSPSKGKQEDWRKWLELHLPIVASVEKNLAEEISKALSLRELSYSKFEELQDEVLKKFSVSEIADDENSLPNLALLKVGDNAALSNSVFDVKRDEIIKLDMHGSFIPFCTKMAFLKYYTGSMKNQIHYWSGTDKKNYIRAIDEVLKNYLSRPISKES